MISIIIPVIRNDRALECIAAVKKNTGLAESEYEVLAVEDKDRIGAPLMVKYLTTISKGDKVCFLGDDTIPEPDFLKNALEYEQQLPDGWGLVVLECGQANKTLATHWLADKRLLPLIGGEFFHTGYIHCFCDNELSLRTQLLNKFIYGFNAKIQHNHPIKDKNIEIDEDLKRVYSQGAYEHDRKLFESRKQQILANYPFTGERVVPRAMNNYISTLQEHLARYVFALGFIKDHVILDAACGTGYGTELMRMVAKGVTGCDNDLSAVAYARAKYGIDFGVCDLETDFPKLEFDTVVSFETIEHLKDPHTFFKNVVANSKQFIFSIPVSNYSQYHKQVYGVEEIVNLVKQYYGENVKYYGQVGTTILALENFTGMPPFVLCIATSPKTK